MLATITFFDLVKIYGAGVLTGLILVALLIFTLGKNTKKKA